MRTEEDLALMQAIYLSMQDMQSNASEVHSPAVDKKIGANAPGIIHDEVSVQASKKDASAGSSKKDVVSEADRRDASTQVPKDAGHCEINRNDAAVEAFSMKRDEMSVMTKSDPPSQTRSESFKVAPQDAPEAAPQDAPASPAPTSTSSPTVSVGSNNSFARDAEGYGAIAENLGEALDKVASVIDEMNLELNRGAWEQDMGYGDSEDEDEAEIVVPPMDAAGSLATPGATILDGAEEMASSNSWSVVEEDEEAVAADEGLALATQAIGYALFNSDMARSQENVSTISNDTVSSQSSSSSSSVSIASKSHMSSITSVPTTLASMAFEGHIAAVQTERWANQLSQLHELGFTNDALNVEIIERLDAANIGVGLTEEVTVQQVINEMMKDW